MKKEQTVRITKFKGQLGRIVKVLPPDDYGNEYLVKFESRKGMKYGVFKEKDLKERTSLVDYPVDSEFDIFGARYVLEYKTRDHERKQNIVLRQVQGPELDKVIMKNEDELIYEEFELLRRPKWKNQKKSKMLSGMV